MFRAHFRVISSICSSLAGASLFALRWLLMPESVSDWNGANMPTKTDRAIRLFWACAIDQQAHSGDNHQFRRHERKNDDVH